MNNKNSNLSEGLDRAFQQVVLQTEALLKSLIPAFDAATHTLQSFRDAVNVKQDGLIYVTVGHPKGDSPFYDRVIVEQGLQTKIQAAKMYRKWVAKDLFYSKPSALYYVIWLYKDNQWLYFWSSANTPVKFMENEDVSF